VIRTMPIDAVLHQTFVYTHDLDLTAVSVTNDRQVAYGLRTCSCHLGRRL